MPYKASSRHAYVQARTWRQNIGRGGAKCTDAPGSGGAPGGTRSPGGGATGLQYGSYWLGYSPTHHRPAPQPFHFYYARMWGSNSAQMRPNAPRRSRYVLSRALAGAGAGHTLLHAPLAPPPHALHPPTLALRPNPHLGSVDHGQTCIHVQP